MAGLRDYSSNPDANISLGGINIAEGWARTSVNNAIREQLAEINDYLLDMGGGVLTTGVPPSYIVTLPSEPAVYANNLLFALTSHWTNSGAAKLNVNGVGERDLKKLENGIEVELEEGDFAQGHTGLVYYRSGTNVFILQDPAGARSHSTPIIIIDRMTAEQRAGLASDDPDDWPYIDDILNAAIMEGNGTIILPRGHMRLAATVNVYRRIKLIGENNGGAGEIATQLIWDADMDGIVVHLFNTGELLGNATGSEFDGIAFLGRRDEGATIGSGIWMRAPTTIIDCMFEQWPVNGVRGIGNIHGTGDTLGNCSLWHMSNVRIFQSGSHGFYLQGGDANAGIGIGIDTRDNGGSGIYDESLLGNTFVACHTASNAGAPYKVTNLNAQSVFLGCYAEGDQPAAEFAQRNIVFGGVWGTLPTGGLRLGSMATGGGNQAISPFVIRNTDINDKTLRLNISGNTFTDYIVNSLEVSNGFSPSYFRTDRQELQWRYNGLDASVSVRVPTGPTPPHLNEADATPIGPGSFILDKIWVPAPGTLAANTYRRLNLLSVARNYQQQTLTIDNGFTLTVGTSPYHTLHTGVLTTGRNVAFSGGVNGSAFLVTRTGAGTPTLNLAGLISLATGDWAEVVHDGTAWYLAAFGRAASGSSGPGDVVGPGSATTNALATFASTTGKLLQNSVATLSGAGLLTAPTINATTLQEGGVALSAKYAALASPDLTGAPTAPTAAPGTATTQIASTAFVGAAVAAVSGASTPIVGYAGTGRDLDTADHNTTINCTSGSAVTLTIPPGLTSGVGGVQFACGIRQGGAGKVTVVAGVGVARNNIDGLFGTEAQYARLILERVAADTFDIIGRTG